MSTTIADMMVRIAADTAKLRSEMDEAKTSVSGAVGSIKSTVLQLVALVGGIELGRKFIEVADSVTLLDARLKLAVGSGDDYAKAQRDIYDISQRNAVGLRETTELYAKLYDPVSRLGGGVRENTAIVEAFSTSLKLGGASTAEAASATLQFAQAMGSGKLSGDEFRSMAEASPRFMRALADGIGVPIEKLKEMGSEGKLTADVVGNALIRSLEELRSEAESIPITFGGAAQRFANDVIVAVGELNDAAGATLGLADAVEQARGLIPIVQEELAGAFQAVGEWITENKEEIGNVISTIGSLIAEVWDVVRAFVAVAAAVGQWALQSGAIKLILDGVRMTVALLKDGVELVAAVFLRAAGTLLGFAGIFSDSAKAAANAANEAASLLFNKFDTGKGSVQTLSAELINNSREAIASKTALTDSATAAGMVGSEMGNAGAKSAAAAAEFIRLKPATQELTAEQTKAAAAAKKHADDLDKAAEGIRLEQLGLNSGLLRDLGQLNTLRDTGRINTETYERAVNSLLAKQPLYQAQAKEQEQAEKDVAKALKDREDQLKKTYAEQERETQKMEDANAKLREQNSVIGLNKAELVAREAALLRQQAEELDLSTELYGTNNALTRQAELLNERADLLEDGVVLAEARAVKEEWEKTTAEIDKSLTDALMRGFESGKGFLENFRDTAVNLFKTVILRPVISAIMSPISQGISGMLGFAGSASAATAGGGGGAMGTLSNMAGVGGLLGSAGAFGSGIMSGLSAWGAGGSVTGLLGSGSALFSGGMASGLGTIAGALGPIAIALAGIYALSKQFSGETRSGSSYAYSETGGNVSMLNNAMALRAGVVTSGGGPSGGAIGGAAGNSALVSAVSGTIGGVNALLSGLGSSAQIEDFWAKVESSGNGRGGVLSGGRLSTGARFGESGFGSNYAGTLFESGTATTISGEDALKAFALDLQQVTIQALQSATDIPDTIRDMLEGVDAESLTEEAVGGLLGAINDTVSGVASLRDAVRTLPMENLADISFDAAAALIDLAGGLDALLGQIRTYVDEYYSTEEKAGLQAQSVVSALQAVGIDTDTLSTREDFRALVESQDVGTETGQIQLAALLSVAGQFASLADYLSENETTLSSLVASSPQTQLLTDMLDPQRSTAESTESMAEGISTSNSILESIRDRLDGISDVAAAAVAAARSASQAAIAAAAVAASNSEAAAAAEALYQSQPREQASG